MGDIFEMPKSKVSVIVPIYNSQETLHRCIESLLRQTYSPLEIILINDGSTDASSTICRAYEKKNENIIVVNKENGGVSSARNAGIKIASGDYIMFCDSDDWVEPDYCYAFLQHFEKGSLVFGNPSSQSSITSKVFRLSRTDVFRIRNIGIGSPVSKLFEAAIIKKNVLRFPEDLSLGEDFIFVLHYLACISGDLIHMDYSVYHYENEEEESLSKRIPSVEQTECYYGYLSEAIEKLNISDKESFFTCDRLCMLDFEKLISFHGRNERISYMERYHLIQSIMSCETYKRICNVGVGSQNRMYEMFYKKRRAFLLTTYYTIIMYTI